MRKNTFEFRNTVLNRLFSQRVRRSRQNESKYSDEENTNPSQLCQKLEKVYKDNFLFLPFMLIIIHIS